jgi:hypothetical protein
MKSRMTSRFQGADFKGHNAGVIIQRHVVVNPRPDL